jgi:hypothetical protein
MQIPDTFVWLTPTEGINIQSIYGWQDHSDVDRLDIRVMGGSVVFTGVARLNLLAILVQAEGAPGAERLPQERTERETP